MKRTLAALLAVVLLGLAGCSSWREDTYYVEESHIEQPLPTEAPTEAEETPVVSNRTELRGTVLSFIRNWTERGEIRVKDYEGDLSGDLSEILNYATQEDPIGAYAVDYADAELTGTGRSGSIALSLVFRRSAAEISSIVTVNGISSAKAKIQQALTAYDTALTLRIRNYADTDIEGYVRDYCLEHLDQIAAVPELSAEVYPNEGATRILELHFSYPDTRDELQRKLASVKTILSSASSYVSAGRTDRDRAVLLYRFLTTRFAYTVGETESAMPAYDLLCEGIAHSLSFAAVFRMECETAGVECWLVSGTRDGQPYTWNLLSLEDGWYHVDLMDSVLSGEKAFRLLTPEQAQDAGYVWDYAAYPAEAAPQEAPEPTAPPTEGPAPEPTEPPVPTEPPTEPPTEEPATAPAEP